LGKAYTYLRMVGEEKSGSTAGQEHLATHAKRALEQLRWTDCQVLNMAAFGFPGLVVKGRLQDDIEFVLPAMPTTDLSAAKLKSLFLGLELHLQGPVRSLLCAIANGNGVLTFYRIFNGIHMNIHHRLHLPT